MHTAPGCEVIKVQPYEDYYACNQKQASESSLFQENVFNQTKQLQNLKSPRNWT